MAVGGGDKRVQQAMTRGLDDIYKQAAGIIAQAVRHEGGTHLLFEDGVENKRLTRALVCETLRHLHVIEPAIKEVGLPTSIHDHHLGCVMVYELLFGRQAFATSSAPCQNCHLPNILYCNASTVHVPTTCCRGLQKSNSAPALFADLRILKEELRATAYRTLDAQGGDLDEWSSRQVVPANPHVKKYVRINTLLTDAADATLMFSRTPANKCTKDPDDPNLFSFPHDVDVHRHPLIRSADGQGFLPASLCFGQRLHAIQRSYQSAALQVYFGPAPKQACLRQEQANKISGVVRVGQLGCLPETSVQPPAVRVTAMEIDPSRCKTLARRLQ
eukprot:gene1643-2862_t